MSVAWYENPVRMANRMGYAGLTALTAVGSDAADLFPVRDVSANQNKTMTRSELASMVGSSIGDLTVSGKATFTGVISPAQLTADTHNWAPTSFATAFTVRASTDAARTLTGLAGGAAGRLVLLLNVGSQDLVLAHESGSSTAANRFDLESDDDQTIAGGGGRLLEYDGVSLRWRVVGGGGGSAEPVVQTISPTADIDDLVVADDTTVLRLNPDNYYYFTGIDSSGSSDGRTITIINVSLDVLNLFHDDAASAAGNRFWLDDAAADLLLNPGGQITVVYDATTGYWHTSRQRITAYDVQPGAFPIGTYDFSVGSIVNVYGQINCDNLRLDGNTLSSQNVNGDITLDPNGTGKVIVPLSGAGDPSWQFEEEPGGSANPALIAYRWTGSGSNYFAGRNRMGVASYFIDVAGSAAIGAHSFTNVLDLDTTRLKVSPATASTSPTTGALAVTGGVGIGGAVNAAGQIKSTVSNGGGASGIFVEAAVAALGLKETGVAADNGVWDVLADAERLAMRAVNDANTAANNWCEIDRTGITVDEVKLLGTTINLAGAVKFGTHSAIGAETVTGYITITDSGGTSRKLAVVS